MSEAETENEGERSAEVFNFDTWLSKLNIQRKVAQILRNEELCSVEALSLLETRDLKELGLPLGAIKVIMADIQKWNKKPSAEADAAPEVTESSTGNQEILEQAGKSLDFLLSGSNTNLPAPTLMTAHMDPRTILTMRATSRKATHITNFLTEKCKRRRQQRRKEFVLRAGKSTETLVLKTEEEHPYLGIFLEEWGAANMRLMNALLQTGELKRGDIEYYLAYTTRIFEFAETYEWSSVLNFDYSYRELQAEHGFQWGTFSPHMELQILTPKRMKPNSEPLVRQAAGHSTEDCRIFKAKGSCPFGDNCRYRHSKQPSKKTTSITNQPGIQSDA